MSTQNKLSSKGNQSRNVFVDLRLFYSTFEINSAVNKVDNQQVGNLWKGDYLVTASLSGELSYLDKQSGKVVRTIDGHSKAITALSVSEEDTLFTGSYDGRVFSWNYGEEGDHTTAQRLEGDGHANQVTALSAKNSELVSTGMDDTLRQASIADLKFRYYVAFGKKKKLFLRETEMCICF